MGTCVICGTDVDGKVCESHQEDVLFHFEGDHASELIPNRYYEGTVDGFADFGVFIDLATGVTGLLHRSEVPGRLESLDWEAGDDVYVQVTGVHENGNIDLGWSIRQSPAEFRHELVQGEETDREVEVDSSDEAAGEAEPVTRAVEAEVTNEPADSASHTEPDAGADSFERDSGLSTNETDHESDHTETVPEPELSEGNDDDSSPVQISDATEDTDRSGAESQTDTDTDSQAAVRTETPDAEESDEGPTRVPIADLADQVGDRVAISGEVIDVRQTSGPTVFTVADETGNVECAAFVGAGERAYPEAEVEDIVRIEGDVEKRRDDLQIETDSLTVLDADERAAVLERIEEAAAERAAAPNTDLLVPDGPTASVDTTITETATAIRRAIFEPRPVIIRHAATVDGYVGSAALERAILPLVEETHDGADAIYHYVDRRPLDDGFYDMSQATRDVTDMLESADRHDEAHPLFVLVDAGSTAESRDGFELLDVYDADRVVIDGGTGTDEVGDAASIVCTAETTATALAADVAGRVNPEIRDDLRHLPAISFWDNLPQTYADLAAENGRESEDVTQLREAVALEAYYHDHGSKRELITDILWDEHQDLAAYVSSQFRAKMAREVETAEPHLESRDVGGLALAVLDAHAFTHRFDFPPTELLLDAIHRDRVAEHEGPVATLIIDEDVLRFRTTEPLSARELASTVAEAVPDAGVRARGSTGGHLEFLRGERKAVLEAAVSAVEDSLAATQQ